MGSLARQGAAINRCPAFGRHDVGLAAPLNGTDVNGRRTEQGMPSLAERPGIAGFQKIDHSRHRMDRISAQMRPRPMRRPSLRFQLKPDRSFVRRRHGQSSRLADDGQIPSSSLLDITAGAVLLMLFIDERGEQHFRAARPRRAAFRQGHHRCQHRSDGPFGVARAPAGHSVSLDPRTQKVRPHWSRSFN